MRSVLVLAVLSSTAYAAPLAKLSADVDGDGAADRVELDPHGELSIATKRGTAKVAVGAAKHATLTTAIARGTPTIVVSTDTDGIVVQQTGGTWKELLRTPLGSGDLDAEFGYVLEARPDGIFRYQARPGYRRCDGASALLFAERLHGSKFQRLSRIPTGIASNAPVIAAKPDTATAPEPLLYRARIASHQPGATNAGALAIPQELDDGKPETAWREDFVASDGEGQFFTYMPRSTTEPATQIRIVASTLKGANRIQRLGVVGAQGAFHVDVPDAHGARGATAYIADLPTPLTGCVTLVIESTYGPANGATSIGELQVFAAGERSGGGETTLARLVAEGADGSMAATRSLAARGAAGAAAIDAELAKTTDAAARRRLVRAALEIRDPAVAPILARAAKEDWIQGPDLVEAITALGALGTSQAQDLRDLAGKGGLALDARIAAVRALRPAATDKDRDALIDLAGRGPRDLRIATIERLSELDTTTLGTAAQSSTSPQAAGDLWRALTRRAHAKPDERAPALSALTAALPTATDYERRYRIVDGIAAIGDEAALRSLTALFTSLPDSADLSAYKQVAARAIAVNHRPEATDLVIKLTTDSDPGVRLAALSALSGAGSGGAGSWHGPSGSDGIDRVIMTSLFTDTWPEVRRFAAQSLGSRCSRPGPARALADSLKRDKDLAVRGDALAGLVECKAAGTAALLAALWDDGNAPLSLRQRAIDLTATLGDRTLGSKLVAKLPQWRAAAIESEQALALAQNAAYAIGRLNPPGAADALVAALGDNSFPEIIAAAATGLGLLGPACPVSAKPKLSYLANTDEEQVSVSARRALATCGQ
ncbi:MAG: hypothetical protein HOV81_35595 [Kofleriaceae bacterium]|nr:hypothetical protein [Kofleriaceae bacterium]